MFGRMGGQFGRMGARANSRLSLLPITGYIGVYASGAVVAGYTGGNLFDVTRVSDLTALTVVASGNGRPALGPISAFLNDGVGVGYVTKIYDQSGNANHATQTVLASAPKVDVTRLANGMPALVSDYAYTSYMAGLGTLAVTSTSAAVLTMTAALPTWLAPGQTVTGTNVPASTTISSLDFTLKKITLSQSTTGNAGSLTITQPKVWMDLPAGVSIATNSHAFFTVGTMPGLQTYVQPITVGTAESSANSTATNWAMLKVGNTSTVSYLRLLVQTGGASAGYSINLATGSFTPHSSRSVYGFTRTLKAFNWWAEDKSGSATSSIDPGSAALTGGSLIFSQQQQAPGTTFGGDYECFAVVAYPAGLASSAQGDSTVAALKSAFGIADPVSSIVFDGSSTTRATGDKLTANVGRRTCDAIGGNRYRALDLGTGQTTEAMYQVYATNGPGTVYDATNSKLLVVHPGLGNSIQQSLSLTITTQDNVAQTLTTSTSIIYPSSCSVGAPITGTNIPAGTTVTAVNTSTGVITLSAAPTGTVSGVAIVGDTAAQAWANIVTYLQAARATGYKILLIGSAPRSTFSGGQLTIFNAAKVLMAANWATYADAYLDLQSITQFAGSQPWTDFSTYWQSDGQHFSALGYTLIATNTATALSQAALI